jgi:uncharacterized protein YjbJ (UPF0337 family)
MRVGRYTPLRERVFALQVGVYGTDDGGTMFKSAKRNKAEGAMDRVGGRIMELVGKVTGRRSQKAKGKAARLRGGTRTKRGQAKKATRGRSKNTTRLRRTSKATR